MFKTNFSEHFRRTLLLAWPVCLSNLGNVMVGIVDTAMVGGIREEVSGYSATTAQAAVSLANAFYFLVLVFGIGVSYGVTPLAAEADSANNREENKKLLSHCLIVNLATSGVLFLLLGAVSPLMRYIHQPEDVVALAIPFLNVMMLGMIPLAVFSSFKQFAEGLSFTRVAMYITIGANLLNVWLNYLLIYGKWGFAPMGVMGACWATFMSRVVMAVAMALYIYYNRNFREYREAFLFREVSFSRIRKIFNIGAASGMQWVFEVGAFAFALVMIGWIGKKEQAAHQIALQVASVTYLIASGISAAASVRVGNQFGTKNTSGLREAAFTALGMIILAQGAFALLFLGFRFLVPGIFNNEPAVQEIVSSLLVIAAAFQISDGIQIVSLGALRGIRDIAVPTWITLVSYWGIGLPLSYAFGFVLGLGVQGVWYGLFVALTVAAVLLFLRFNYVTRRIAWEDQPAVSR